MELREFRRVMLHAFKIKATERITSQLLHRMELNTLVDHQNDQVIFEFETYIYGRQSTESFDIVESPIYHSWQHHKVASLTPFSFLRRFWLYFYGLDEKDLAIQRVHHVTATAQGYFPDLEGVGNIIEVAVLDRHTEVNEV